MGVMRTLLLKGSHSAWLKEQVQRRRFAKRAVRRFMPGESMDDALRAADALSAHRMHTVLTLLGEDVLERGQAEEVTLHYLDLLHRVERQQLPAHISVKPTQLGLGVDRDLCAEQLHDLATRASALGNFVWIDMEASEYVDATLDLYRVLRGEYVNVGVCLQSYLYRTADDLEALLPIQPTIRLVKGAYDEPPHVAYRDKQDVDENFIKLAKRLLSPDARQGNVKPGFGTHDLHLIRRIQDYAEGAGIPQDAYEVQMLYGIRRDDQQRLAAEGSTLRVLISYGDAWFPWYMRRLAERPANLLFAARAVLG